MKAHVNLTKDSTDLNRNVCVCAQKTALTSENSFIIFLVFWSRLTNSQMPGMKLNKSRRRNDNRSTERIKYIRIYVYPGTQSPLLRKYLIHTPVAMIVCVWPWILFDVFIEYHHHHHHRCAHTNWCVVFVVLLKVRIFFELPFLSRAFFFQLCLSFA